MKIRLLKWLTLVVGLMVSLGIFSPKLARANELSADVMTSFTVQTNPDNSPVERWGWSPINVEATLVIPDGVAHAGDTTTIDLPHGFRLASPLSFDVLAPSGEVLAKATTLPGETKLILTYTNYVENNLNITGNFFFNIQIDDNIHKIAGNLPLNFVANAKSIFGGTVKYLGAVAKKPEDIVKGGWTSSVDVTKSQYQVKINQANKTLTNVVLKDTLAEEGEFIPASFKIYQGAWNTDLVIPNEIDVTSQYINNIKWNGHSFELPIGNLNNVGLRIVYQVQRPYVPIAGEKFTNTARLESDQITKDWPITYATTTAGGAGEGNIFTIQVKKVNDQNEPLQGAVFDVVRDRTQKVVGQLVTDQNGDANLTGLLKDNYTLVETTTPIGYRNTSPTPVLATEFDATTKTASKTIINSHEVIDYQVIKKWEDNSNQAGKRPASITVQLYKSVAGGNVLPVTGQTLVLTEANKTDANTWVASFTGLTKYENGQEVTYSVKEDDVTIANLTTLGYIAKVSGQEIVNSLPTVKISGSKIWHHNGNQNPPTAITVKIMNGTLEVDSIDVSAGDGWVFESRNLPKYANGQEIVYTVKEVPVPGYTTSLVQGADGRYVLTNTYSPAIPSIPIPNTRPNSGVHVGQTPTLSSTSSKSSDANTKSSDRTDDSSKLSNGNNGGDGQISQEIANGSVPTSARNASESKILPKTGEQDNILVTIFGMMLATVGTMFIAMRKQRK